ncbi:MAG: cyclase family protein [Solobacterium sp.]|nr:cyclase family protein [Solobacterium sp.]
MIYDITQPLFECTVYPGDTKPQKRRVQDMDKGDLYNLTDISLCVHNGTHVDAPLHFYRNGKGIDRIPLARMIGPAYVAEHNGMVSAEDAERIWKTAGEKCAGAQKKILIKGDAVITAGAAQVFAQKQIDLIGNESQSVGPVDAPMEVHLILLGAEVVLLEGIVLKDVPEGVYFLNCAPLNLKDTDGSPCRAVLLEYTGGPDHGDQ